MREILTSIDIDAPRERVWAILTDTRAYDEWNPFVTRVRGDLAPGAPLDFMVPIGTRDVPIRARLLRVDSGREIRWQVPRVALLGRVFTGEHFLRLDDLGEGRTRFTHGEHFTGAVPALLWSRLEPRLAPLYTAMNDALKRRAESQP